MPAAGTGARRRSVICPWLAGVWLGLTPWLTALGAQQGGTTDDSGFVLAADDPARTPSPFIGNGHLGVTVPVLGIGESRALVAGVYDDAPRDVPRIAAVPSWSNIDVHDGTRWLGATVSGAGSPGDGSVRGYRQELDMRTGTARTGFEWGDGNRGASVRGASVRVEAFVSRAVPGLAAVRLRLTPRARGRLRVRFALAAPPAPRRLALATIPRASPSWKLSDVWYPGHMVVHSRGVRPRARGARLWMTSRSEGRASPLAQVVSVAWEREPRGMITRSRALADTALVEVAFDASAGRTYGFTEIVSVASAVTGPPPLLRATRAVEAAGARGYDGLAADNARAWRRRWETDIQIDGDPALQRVVRAMLFYLLASADSGTGLGIPPMGLSSAGYYGHIFWDSDTWMFPSLLITHPDVARSLVGFRERTLPAARANARMNRYRGAMYPWEADERGEETTPHFAAQNARSEIHVNGDVALAQWQYYLASGDSAWLARHGYPVIWATADFWVSRASHDSATDRYHIRNVVSVSEGLIGVTDDAYTNAVARKNLETAAAASARLGLAADPRWAEVAAKLHLPFDSATGFFRTYAGAPDSTLGEVTPLLSYPLGVTMNDSAKRAHLDQAVARFLAQGSGAMMGSTLLSVAAAELGDGALVDSLLGPSYLPHLRGPFLMLSETPTNEGVNFVTGAGGFLQQVLFGYTGLRLGKGGLEPAFPPLLPSGVTRLTLRNIHVRGRRYDVIVDRTGRRIVPRGDDPAR